jgi:hypothetical protein
MASSTKETLMALELGLRAARRMALQRATTPPDQVDEANVRETEILATAVSIAADDFAIEREASRRRFEGVVSQALDLETGRIRALLARGSASRH